jgi:hypothetical protein
MTIRWAALRNRSAKKAELMNDVCITQGDKMTRKVLVSFLSVLVTWLINSQLLYAEEIQIAIKGMDDGKKTTRQLDYKEAVLDAKLKAIEQAGAEIKSLTIIKDFKLKEDNVEAKSEGLLLPGYQIIDIGYTADGTYQVVLTGKLRVKTAEPKEKGALRYVISMIKQGQDYKTVRAELDKILHGSDSESSAGALYYLSVIEYIYNRYDSPEVITKSAYGNLERMKSYYPDSLWVKKLERVIKKQSIYHKFKWNAIATIKSTTIIASKEVYMRNTYQNDNFTLTVENKDSINNIKYGEFRKESNFILDTKKEPLQPFFWKTIYTLACGDKNCLINKNAEFTHKDELGREELFKIEVNWNIDARGKYATTINICVDNNCNTGTTNSEQVKIGRYSFHDDTIQGANGPFRSIITMWRDDLASVVDEIMADNQKNN